MIKTTLKLHVSKSRQSHNLKRQQDVGVRKPTKTVWKTGQMISVTGRLGMSQYLAHAQHQQGTVSIIHQWSRDPEVQAIIHQEASEHCLSKAPESTPLVIASAPVITVRIHQLGETSNPRSQDEHKYTHKQQAQQWGQMGTCPETGHRGQCKKSKHGTCHRQGLNLWLGKANEATASQH